MTESTSHRSPREVVERYLDTLYSQNRADMVEELIAPETWRHTPGGLEKLTLQQSKERIDHYFSVVSKSDYEHSVVVAEGEYVASVWRAKLTHVEHGDMDISGIEVYRVVDGKIVEAWNQDPAYGNGLWKDSRFNK